MDYVVAIGFTIVELEIAVEKMLRDGFQCQGGIAIKETEEKAVYMQAMTRS